MAKSLIYHRHLFLILLLALVVRLFQIDNSVLDWHAFRQADTASVTREYIKNGIDLLRPRYHDLSNIQSGKDNLEGWRMVEFPIENAAVALTAKLVPIDLVLLSRLFSIGFSLIAIAALYGLVNSISGKRLALWSAFFMSVLPYSIYYSRVVLPEPAMLATSIISLYFFDRWLKKQNYQNYLFSLLALSLSLLLKPYVIFTTPIYLALAWTRLKTKMFLLPQLYLFPILAVMPLYFWRNWILNFESGIPASDWLLNGNLIRFRPAWFRWLFWERIGKLILGIGGILISALALTKPIRKNEWFIYGGWWLGMFTYLSVFATGNVQHDYYQVLLIPILAITLALGTIRSIAILGKLMPHWLAKDVTGIILAVGLIFSWGQVVGYFQINHPEYSEAGRAVDELTPEDALIIAPAFGDTQFLFQTNRRGWPIGFEIEKKIELGAEYYVNTAEDDETKLLESQYTIVRKTDKFTLIDLRHKKSL